MNESEIAAAGAALLAARASNSRLDVSRYPSVPSGLDDAYAIQRVVAAGTGAVGAWKIGAPAPQAQATFAALPLSGLCASGSALGDNEHRMRGVEVEIAYRLAEGLPQRASAYSAEEVAAAVDAVVPVIEVVETRLSDRNAGKGMWALADNVSHGELVLGQAVSGWRDLSLLEVTVLLRFDDKVIIDRVCRNAGGHPFDLVVRLANLCGTHCGGLRAGQIITTGSLMGLESAPAGATVSAMVGGVGAVEVTFEG